MMNRIDFTTSFDHFRVYSRFLSHTQSTCSHSLSLSLTYAHGKSIFIRFDRIVARKEHSIRHTESISCQHISLVSELCKMNDWNKIAVAVRSPPYDLRQCPVIAKQLWQHTTTHFVCFLLTACCAPATKQNMHRCKMKYISQNAKTTSIEMNTAADQSYPTN